MKTLVFFLLGCFIISCNLEDSRLVHKKEYSFNELTVNFIRGTRATTFIKNGKPISGIVVQNLRRGGKNIWEVQNGLAIKQTRYYSNGEKFVEQFYENGEPVGTWHRWNRDGELVETTRH